MINIISYVEFMVVFNARQNVNKLDTGNTNYEHNR